MPINTAIEWCDSTTNPTTGCEGCELWNGRNVRHCYAGNLHEARLAKSLPAMYDEDFQNVRLAPGRMMKAARWADLRDTDRPDKPWLNGFPRTIFVGDMGDFASKSVPFEYFRDEVIAAIASPQGSRHFWLLLTKQARRLAEWSEKLGKLPDNVMAMTTVTDQHTANTRLPDLLKVKCRYRGISAEPLLGPVDLSRYLRDPFKVGQCVNYCTIDWIIAGGESGPNARPMNPDWARSLRDQCADAQTPFLFKQWGKHFPVEQWEYNPELILTDEQADAEFAKVGKKAAGRLLDGVEHNGMPRLI